jgi:N6-L-threonylcarbamoyladenine synthase
VNVLGIETSCDETAAAVVADGRVVRSSIVSSQIDLHARYGGVVPEIAGRAHVERIVPAVTEALAGTGLDRPQAVAATYGPGLIGSLLVGLSAAKALAMSWDVPFVGVNHLEGHLFAPVIEEPSLEWPLVVLLVSGGHTLLVLAKGPGHYRLLGQTIDDAAGEAFDKVARFLGLGYPGGPAIDRAAREGDPAAYRLPRALMDGGYDFSFSGLKTAVVRTVERHPHAATVAQAVRDLGAAGLCLGGGVAANSLLRARAPEAVDVPTYLPSLAMCTDNAAMVAAAGSWRLEHDGPSPLSLGPDPNLSLRFTT